MKAQWTIRLDLTANQADEVENDLNDRVEIGKSVGPS